MFIIEITPSLLNCGKTQLKILTYVLFFFNFLGNIINLWELRSFEYQI